MAFGDSTTPKRHAGYCPTHNTSFSECLTQKHEIVGIATQNTSFSYCPTQKYELWLEMLFHELQETLFQD